MHFHQYLFISIHFNITSNIICIARVKWRSVKSLTVIVTTMSATLSTSNQSPGLHHTHYLIPKLPHPQVAPSPSCLIPSCLITKLPHHHVASSPSCLIPKLPHSQVASSPSCLIPKLPHVQVASSASFFITKLPHHQVALSPSCLIPKLPHPQVASYPIA